MKKKEGYDYFLAEIYDFSPYFGKERKEKDYATTFYLDNLPNNREETVLELVTCTGLLTLPMARAGYKIDSVDASQAVHDIVRRKLTNEPKYVADNITLFCCNVFNYKPDRKYSTIVLPDSFLCAIADKELQESLIRMCYNLLDSNGRLILDIFVPWKDFVAKRKVDQCSRFRVKKNKLFIVHAHHLIDPEKQTHRVDFVHELYRSTQRYSHTVIYRYMYLPELLNLIEKGGFEVTYIEDRMNFGTNVAVVAKKIN